LIIRGLDDETMVHIMADENMQEGAAESSVAVETVRAVRDFLGGGAQKVSPGGRPLEPDDRAAITAFLGWPEVRCF
jgi:hypothetical protein